MVERQLVELDAAGSIPAVSAIWASRCGDAGSIPAWKASALGYLNSRELRCERGDPGSAPGPSSILL